MEQKNLLRVISFTSIFLCFFAILFLYGRSEVLFETYNRDIFKYTTFVDKETIHNSMPSKLKEPEIRTCTQEERRAHIQKVCSKYTELQEKGPANIFYDPERNLAYCVIPKNGCTTWKKVFARSTTAGKNMSTDFDPHSTFALEKRGIIQDHTLNANSTKNFVIFRHPMSRFLSAHYEKMMTVYKHILVSR